MNAIVIEFNEAQKEQMGRLVEFLMVGEREVLLAALDDYHRRIIIDPKRSDPYQSDEDVLNER